MSESVLLVNPSNPDPAPNYFGPPYGLALIGAVLRDSGVKVACADFDDIPLERSIKDLPGVLRRVKPDIVGMACQSSTRGAVYAMLDCLRKVSGNIKIVLGGPFATQTYRELLKRFPIDCVVLGDGEYAMKEIVSAFSGKRRLESVKGIALSRKGRIIVTRDRELLLDLDVLPFPAFELFDFEKKISPALCTNADPLDLDPLSNFVHGRRCSTMQAALMLLSSRGCIYSCTFCPMSGVKKAKLRFYSVEYFLNMVEYFHRKYKLRDFVFGDNFFTYDRNRVISICEGIRRRRLPIRWMCMTRPDCVDLKMLRNMAEAGCTEISYGVESFSDEVQNKIRKRLDLSKVKNCFKNTSRAGIRSTLMLMVGNPGDSRATMGQNLSSVREFDPDRILVKTTRVYPGTRLHDIAVKNGIIPAGYYEGTDHHAPVFTLEHSRDAIRQLKKMLQPRRAYLEISDICGNGCADCRRKPVCVRNAVPIKSRLSLAASRAEHIVLGGRDPLLVERRLFDVIEMAGLLDVHHVHISSSARMLVYRSLVSRLRSANIVETFLVPFFGATPQSHDGICRVPGAFIQQMKGIANWCGQGGSVRAGLYVTTDSMEGLHDLVESVLRRGVTEIDFVFFGGADWCRTSKSEEVPRWERVKPYLEEAQALVRDVLPRNCDIWFSGCTEHVVSHIGGTGVAIPESWRPFDEKILSDGRIENISRKRAAKLERSWKM